MNWYERIKRWSIKTPNKLALVGQRSQRQYTYEELIESAEIWAGYLKSKGVKPGDRVAFLDTNCMEHILLLLACSQLGAIFVPINYRNACAEIREVLERTQPKVFLGRSQVVDSGQLHFTSMDSVQLGKERVSSEVDESKPVLMLFTSGTTGHSKGVLLHGQMLRENQEQTVSNWNLVSDDITLVDTPFFHTGGYNVLCLPLLSIGGTVILSKKFTVDSVFDGISHGHVSVYFGVPTMFQMLIEDERFATTDFSSLRFFVSGGASCPVKLIQTYQEKGLLFKQGFGLTEVGPNCFLLQESESINKAGSIGRPMPHSKVKLVDNQGEEVGSGQVGELLIKGPHICAGYWMQDEKFKNSCQNGYFKTGDLAKKDQDGFYYIVGRKKDMFISGGENVYPAEVEKRMVTHPDVSDVVVVPVKDEKWGEVGLAFLQAQREISSTEWREYLKPLLSKYKQPQVFQYFNKLPQLANGKIDRNRLKALARGERKAL